MLSSSTRCLLAGALLLMALGSPLAEANEWYHIKGGIIHDVSFWDANKGCTAEDGGRIRYTGNGGSTWDYAVVPDEIRTNLGAIFWRTVTEVWACGDGGVVLKSTDSGASWSWENDPSNGGDLVHDAYDAVGATPTCVGLSTLQTKS